MRYAVCSIARSRMYTLLTGPRALGNANSLFQTDSASTSIAYQGQRHYSALHYGIS
jgi:hypothetical protein